MNLRVLRVVFTLNEEIGNRIVILYILSPE